ncbi:MAG: hypothetical protein COU35_01330 [Candidatus Magasanikbacteria bacterium CG10_big_fil_rev_8_21_14_0_10_47_10]|uniref:Uncharacterized protein n=1 Tax=Candidatus Magasanikbacteria bacterium CG10_big_fil_rev_8_21_14_0_10_47_10 TaxID=1974652 RepID=A0A2H0TRC6_9BACT|nr:MAG: hypothetical protein COU35_01330 [Candidatus Magasanikbacteria bacterium CG10_big_fil_rev_8_21_14_0_10_47_10]
MITLEERGTPEGRKKRQPYLSGAGYAQAWLNAAICSDRWLVNVELFDPTNPDHRLDYFDFLGHIREKKTSRWLPTGTTALIYAIALASSLERVQSIAFDHTALHDTMPDTPEHLRAVLDVRARATALTGTVAGPNVTLAQICHMADQVRQTLRMGAPNPTPIPPPPKPTALLVRLGGSEDE